MKSWKSICAVVGAIVLAAAAAAAIIVFHERIVAVLRGTIDTCDCFLREKVGKRLRPDEYDDYADVE